MEEYRKKAKTTLKLYSKIPKNIEIIERNIYKNAERNTITESDREISYKEILYETMYFFETGKKVKEIVNILKEGKIGYNSEDFEICRIKQKEYDEYLENPFNVVKGLVKCGKCGGVRTISYYRQDRSCDEGTSVYSQCLDCKYKWRENN
jgi:DNA-directed RNA polymerase subunit M/transcription elongation factor TFIIS